MTDMTPEAALALRKPFPKESIGKLPKGGAMLDYVGHAAVTDRLLTIDPAWSWEPLALTPEGLPALDRSGNLWIKLTICGITRLGVGDGKSAKECIGDAIRNAAMRFGVALDLWAKEDLVEFAQAATTPTPATKPKANPVGTITDAQSKKMHVLLGQIGVTDRTKYVQLAGWFTKREDELTSTSQLTTDEASAFIEYLAGRVRDLPQELPEGQAS